MLKPEQQIELREAIDAWRNKHPIPEKMLGIRGVGFALEVGRTPRTATPESSFFTLLRLDPLSSLDPATRVLAETRLFTECAVTNITQLALSMEQFAGVAEQLPEKVSAEREELLKAVRTQEQRLTMLSANVRQTILAGPDVHLSEFDADHFRRPYAPFRRRRIHRRGPPKTGTEPVRILGYAQTATQLESAASGN